MNGDVAFQALLAADTTYQTHVGSATPKIFYDEADQNTQLPFAIVSLDSVEASDTDTGVSTLDFDHVTITHFAETKLKVAEMAFDCRNAVDRKAGKYNDIIIESVQFETQRSGSEYLVDKRVFTIEQSFQVMTQAQRYFDYYFDFQFE